MKLDIVRAFELSDAELESVYGADGLGGGLGGFPGGGLGGFPGGGLGAGVGAGSSFSAANGTRLHSFAFSCDRNLFSTNRASNEAEIGAIVPIASEVNLIDIANPVHQVCLSNN